MSETTRKLLRYAELAAKQARSEASPKEISEMNEIERELKLTREEILRDAEKEIHKRY